MVKTKQTKLVKGSASSKKLNLQLKRAQSRKKELKDRKQAKKKSTTQTRLPKPPKIHRETSAHKSKKLNKWKKLLKCIEIPELLGTKDHQLVIHFVD